MWVKKPIQTVSTILNCSETRHLAVSRVENSSVNSKRRTLTPTCRAITLERVTLLMMHTARVKRPAEEDARRRAASGRRRQAWRHCRQANSSSNARRMSDVGGDCACLICTARNSSSSSVTPSRGSPMNSCTKLQQTQTRDSQSLANTTVRNYTENLLSEGPKFMFYRF